MPYQTPITIKAALDHIHRHEYVLPAIQREFVWRPEVGIADEPIERSREHVNRLGNLRLLEGSFNRAKNDRLPHNWLAEMYPAPEQRSSYQDRHDLTGLPETIDKFEQFYHKRRERMTNNLMSVLVAA